MTAAARPEGTAPDGTARDGTPPDGTGSTVVVALGGNALVRGERRSILDQLDAVEELAVPLVDLVASGHRLVVTHGNGPQVGFILRRSELALAEVAPVPIDFAVADTQGAIGHMFLLALRNELHRRGLSVPVTAVVTDVVVDADDPGFTHPTKPIGSPMDEERARTLAARFGWSVAPETGGGWRRVVASPEPRELLEGPAIAALSAAGHVVVAAGGGGIPVVRRADGSLDRAEAVVDKDLTSALLAAGIGARHLVIVTSVDRVAVAYGRPGQRWLDRVDADELAALAAAGEFPAGSMGPKVASILRFLATTPASGPSAVVTSVDRVVDALGGRAGTTVTRPG